ncbi:hypothetical protein [Bacillus sp. NPDC094106]|uniref:hypothetical protein n=1 Tax=Bacillus sp. NPDC094106 TaxID=3363949 RepID=UPI003816CE2C
MKKDSKELQYILDYVFEHYIEADITDEQRAEVEAGYNQIKEILGMVHKQEFLKEVKEGKWFQTKDKQGRKSLIKLGVNHKDNELMILWLSNKDPESMAYSDVKESSFELNNGVLTINEAFSYHFGLMEPGNDCIYDAEGVLDESKLKEVVLRNSHNGFVSESEFDDMWASLKAGAISSIPFLEVR